MHGCDFTVRDSMAGRLGTLRNSLDGTGADYARRKAPLESFSINS
jgi:hypothetical protein